MSRGSLDLTPALGGNLVRTVSKGEDKVDTESNAGEGAAPGLAADIVCDLAEENAATQAERWLRLGRQAGLGRAETAGGLDIRFRDEPAVERELRHLVSVESKCCAWVRWEVHRAGGELVMRVTSTPEGAAALHAMFGA